MKFKHLIGMAGVFTLTGLAAVTSIGSAADHTWAVDTSWQAKAPGLEMPEGWFLVEVPGVLQSTGNGGKPGAIYVLNRGEHALLKFKPTGKFDREIGHGLFKSPHGLREDADGNIWTTDVGNHLVLQFTPGGELLRVYGRRDYASPGWFDRDYNYTFFDKPSDVAFDAGGNLYVADGGNFRIVKFDPDGNMIKSFGEKGEGEGQFNFPHSVVVKGDTLYVGDRENQRIQLFDLDGKFREVWSGVGYPYGLEALPDGGFLMTDARAEKLVRLDENGKVLSKTGAPGKALGQYVSLHGVAARPDGGVLVSDIFNWRVTALAPAGKR
ncbi:peptidyl-alpha-hydroxyglycine alpha-amidating lyase family protein [Kordiimonas aestuarii]|uniref:peptidyl-alpha-hydroxyglycine alpha-amidating lyase family protein n=1 Tax=Kordiimonas aestuarii TaxID=1005925 RepID=UPI0021CFF6F0|nr:peptidyl-alpha-hydroxyglycine alpha-amidating lyase family protein [Kordiimonas aestuarii]